MKIFIHKNKLSDVLVQTGLSYQAVRESSVANTASSNITDSFKTLAARPI